jgi:2-polyprenyl-6-methoxyphenol hydroxylase-like FAD-dependent oxidoreductase
LVGGRRIPDDMIRIRRPWGHAERYGGNGAVLLGDAIHPVSPAGGQGANMSVADATVVAELAVRGGTDWVQEYERRRRPANERSMNITRRTAQVLSLPNFLIALGLPWLLRWVNRRPERLFARVLPLVSTAFQESLAERPVSPKDS